MNNDAYMDRIEAENARLRGEVDRLRGAIARHRDEARAIAQSSTTPVHPVDERLWSHLT